MKQLIFFDTETTGNTEEDYLCQIAYKTGEETFSGFYKPPIKIPPEASAVHHITNKMVDGRSAFRESEEYRAIKNLFEGKDTVVVAHNAPFDLAMIGKEGIQPANFICTLRLIRHLDEECKIERYNLQYLRYLLELDVEANAHDALGDVLVLEKLFEHLKREMAEGGKGEDEIIAEMLDISAKPSLIRRFTFGKFNGRPLKEIVEIEPGYLEWLLGEKQKESAPDEDWIYTLKHHLGK